MPILPTAPAYHKKTRAFALSAHHAALYIGVMTTGCVGGFIAEHWGWRSTVCVFGTAGVLIGSMSPWIMGHCRHVLHGDGLSYAFASLSVIFVIGGLANIAAAVFTFRRDVRRLGNLSAM